MPFRTQQHAAREARSRADHGRPRRRIRAGSRTPGEAICGNGRAAASSITRADRTDTYSKHQGRGGLAHTLTVTLAPMSPRFETIGRRLTGGDTLPGWFSGGLYAALVWCAT